MIAPGRTRTTALLLATAVAATLGPACAPAVKRPPAGYERRVDALDSVDPSGLAGKRIVLDPGHGGRFPGSIGVRGFTEAEANLGVALELRALLEARGAAVLLTRDTDRDFLTPADSSLRFDLAERVRIANAFAPDLFVSIHHNADAGGRHDVNEIQTYYKLGDEGPSLDVAQDVHRALVRNVGIPAHKVLPGNYYVIRNSTAPALLTETSYITYPPVEAALRQPEKRRLEAEALYLGIARYFARPLPVVASFAALDPATGAADSVHTDGPRLAARVSGAFDWAELEVNGESVTATRRGDVLEWAPARPLAQGRHRATLRVRRTGVGAARERALEFRIARPPSAVAVSAWPESPARDAVFGVRTRVTDRAMLPHPDSTDLHVTVAVPNRATPAPRRARALAARTILDTLVVARDGVAWAYVRAESVLEFSARRVPRPDESRVPEFDFGRVVALAPASARAPWTGFVRRMPEDVPLRDAPGTREPWPRLGWLNRDGFAVLPRGEDGRPVAPALPGYREWARTTDPANAAAAAATPPAYVAVAGGALHGRRIVIDPDGGGDASGGMGRGGTRAAALNLDVARALAAMLQAAGADVRLTRASDQALSELQRVQISEAFGAERFVRIGHRAERAHVGHYFSSAAGRRWAQRVAEACAALGLPAPPVAENAQYPIQQTSCPALYAGLARIDDPADEARLVAPGTVSAEAHALYLALAREWPAGDAEVAVRVDSVAVRGAGGAPLGGAAVTFGRAILLETDAMGRVRYGRTEAGPIAVEARGARAEARGILVESDRGLVLTASPLP